MLVVRDNIMRSEVPGREWIEFVGAVMILVYTKCTNFPRNDGLEFLIGHFK
jgi:hypothetical protein